MCRVTEQVILLVFFREEKTMDQKKIGSFIKELRKEKDLTQEQLAEKLNVTRQTISKWELGLTTPEMDKLLETYQD